MNELMMELGIWIGSAAALGLVAGFFLGLARVRSGGSLELAHLEERLQELRRQHERKDELREALQQEITRLQAEQEAMAERQRALQVQLDEGTQRVRELEREREQARKEAHEQTERQQREREATVQTTSAPEPTPLESTPLELERESLVFEVEKSLPLTVDRSDDDDLSVSVATPPFTELVTEAATATATQTRAESEVEAISATTTKTPPEQPVEAPRARGHVGMSGPVVPVRDEGAERDLADIADLPDAVKERLALIGARTNLAFLRKAGRRGGRRALIASTRLDESKLLGWLQSADLMRVGLRAEDMRALGRAGIHGLAQLARADETALAARLRSQSERRGQEPVDVAALARWIERARELEPLVEI